MKSARAILAAGTVIRATIDIKLPANATDEEFDEWLRFVVGEGCQCRTANPLLAHDLEASRGTVRWYPA